MSENVSRLIDLWKPYVEHNGFILKDGTIVEVPNVHEHPNLGFQIHQSDIEKYRDQIAATWHTHPHTSANLSSEDFFCFLAYPAMHHYIISQTEAWCFYVENGAVLLYEEDNSPRVTQGSVS